MKSIIRAALALSIAASLSAALACSKAGEPSPPSTPSTPATAATPATLVVSTEQTRAAALRGELPDGPEVNIAASRCAICHTTQYLTQQRLTEAQWSKTIEKMKKWGAPIDEAESASLARYLGTHFPAELADASRPKAP